MSVWMTDPQPKDPAALERLKDRRRWIQLAAGGAVVSALGGTYWISESATRAARGQTRPDGRPRLPPGQRVLSKLKAMGGQPGDPRASAFSLKVSGDVERPFSVNFAELLKMDSVALDLDVHCVTGWSVLGASFRGVRVQELAERAGVKPGARYAIFEAAHGYTTNLPLAEALRPDALISWELDGKRLPRAHGAPVRAVNPNLYFWKSPKWLTGIRFVSKDEPGYWEVRGYHNYADPWKEQRYA